MIVSNGLGCVECGGTCGNPVEEGLAGIFEGLGATIFELEEAADSAQAQYANDLAAGIYGTALATAASNVNTTSAALAQPYVSNPVPVAQQPIVAQVLQQAAPIVSVPNVPISAALPNPVIVSVSGAMQTTPPVTPSQTIQQSQTSGASGTGTTPITTVTTTTSDNPIMDWLGLSTTPSPSLIGGIPNWLIAIGGIGALFIFGGKFNE